MLQSRFERMGARLKVGTGGRREQPLALDIQSDAAGEYFDVRLRPKKITELEVVDLRPRVRHLLLQATGDTGRHYFLCGHDEMHWFVAGIPEAAGALTNVFAAMEALKPPEVVEAQRRQGIKGKNLQRRKNAAYVRQGEWFFLPMPRLHVKKEDVLQHEPLSRGNSSKPHWAEFLYRKGGEAVYVCPVHPQGLRHHEYFELLRKKPRAKTWTWQRMFRNPEAYIKGCISHPDHQTICLQVWHKVLMNTENQSQAMQHVVFLD
ncbi:MAG: hypothetical protein AB7K24_24650 [Gemmataceae bacterium]